MLAGSNFGNAVIRAPDGFHSSLMMRLLLTQLLLLLLMLLLLLPPQTQCLL